MNPVQALSLLTLIADLYNVVNNSPAPEASTGSAYQDPAPAYQAPQAPTDETFEPDAQVSRA